MCGLVPGLVRSRRRRFGDGSANGRREPAGRDAGHTGRGRPPQERSGDPVKPNTVPEPDVPSHVAELHPPVGIRLEINQPSGQHYVCGAWQADACPMWIDAIEKELHKLGRELLHQAFTEIARRYGQV